MQGLNRRGFLGLAAMAGASVVAAPLLSNRTETPSEKLLKGNKMKTRKLGNLEVSEIGLGCMNMAGNYNPASRSPAIHRNDP